MSRRSVAKSRVDPEKTISFKFNGQTFQGLQGDTLASALLANGVSLVARSWKYHRPRGIMGSGVEEPNALVQLFEGTRTVPNARMTEVELVEGLVATSIHATPSLTFDWRAVNGWIARLIPAGFYYKTFMSSQAAWHFFEKHIRAASGLGASPMLADTARYDKQYVHCDALIVGGGIAGLMAALTLGRSGARVILCDEQSEPGGWLLSCDEKIDDMPAVQWVEHVMLELSAMPEVRVLRRTTAFGFHDHKFITLVERLADHLPLELQPAHRERLWKVRAREVILATGAHERPLVFANNDRPGIMLAGAVSTYIRRYSVVLGKRAVVFTNNDQGYDAARALHQAGTDVHVIDARKEALGAFARMAREEGIAVTFSSVITEAQGGMHVQSVSVQGLSESGALSGQARRVRCDLVAMSGGMSPVIHLHCQAGSKAVWSDAHQAFLPGASSQAELSAGACAGVEGLLSCAQSGLEAGHAAMVALGLRAAETSVPAMQDVQHDAIRSLWLVPHAKPATRAPKQFVDFQNDVAASDILLAVREGFESIEHVKRYTAMGFGTDQGKTGNINGMGIVAQAMGKTIPQVGTTTFRPNYTPVTFGVVAGLELGDSFEPVRKTAMHDWHVQHHAMFEDVGQWKRPRYYPVEAESLGQAVAREVIAVRERVGMLDASTLGKIDIQGPDAATLLNWVYCNAWSKLPVGKCRYGLMLDENGMVFDDGVTVRLAENHYLMHTTTGGAARVLAWLERWLQTEWPELRVYLTSVTDHWSTTVVAGPDSRQVLRAVCSDIDFDDTAFPFMSYREGTVCGVPARLMRISFSGERCYEVNVAADQGAEVWSSLHTAGQTFGITAYGTETMHVLRAEKGFIIVGQDTDGSMTPLDLGMSGLIAANKDFLGKRSLTRSDTSRSDRKQLVGLLTLDPALVLPEGSQIIITDAQSPMHQSNCAMQGHVTSSYFSPTLGRSIALAVISGGLSRLGEAVSVSISEKGVAHAQISHPVFYDPQSERQHA